MNSRLSSHTIFRTSPTSTAAMARLAAIASSNAFGICSVSDDNAKMSNAPSTDAGWDLGDPRSGQSPNVAGQVLELAGGHNDESAAGQCPSPEQYTARDLRIRLASAEAGFQMQMPGNRREPGGCRPFDRPPI